MIGYHVTTPAKLSRYEQSGSIYPPVRFWPGLHTAQQWASKTGRTVILRIEVQTAYPLPDHVPAHWSPEHVREWEVADER